MKNRAKTSRKFDFTFLIIFFNENDEIMYLSKDTYCLTLIHKNDLEIDYNHDTGLKLENLIAVLQ